MAEQMGYTIDPSKAPPRIEDLPEEVSIAFELYSYFPDKVDGMAGYLGKDFSLFGTLMSVYEISKNIQAVVLEILVWMNQRAVTKAQAQLSKKPGANSGKKR